MEATRFRACRKSSLPGQVRSAGEFQTQRFITSTHFKKEADGSKWSPRRV
jgi:hypothetical protein